MVLGEGLMTITPVIGSALIKTYKLLGTHRGSVTVLPAAYRNELEPGTVAIEANGVLHPNWIESGGDTLDRCRHSLRIGTYDTAQTRLLFGRRLSAMSARAVGSIAQSLFLASPDRNDKFPRRGSSF